MLYPLTFQPIFKERIWGGRELERLFGKALPPGAPIGESWEITDRAGDTSVITNGPLAGQSLHRLMADHAAELLGSARAAAGHHFPLLCKILDAREKLSLQVHPPAARAAELKGEPKTEMWYIADAGPGAELYAGLRPGVSRGDFERKIQDGTVAECFHRVPVRAGDAMFLPSGRVHAIGDRLVIFEIQQNSDTTYRVFDWNRAGLDGRPRELHVAESLASIDFNDFAPGLVVTPFRTEGGIQKRALVNDPLFKVEVWQAPAGARAALPPGRLQIVAVTTGAVEIQSGGVSIRLSAGQFGLLPASLAATGLSSRAGATLLRVEAGQGG